MSDFKNLNLSDKILAALDKKGYSAPTPIQIQSIPHLLEGKDLLGIAQTGTGKTAAFALPILDNLAKTQNKVRANNMRCLILTPTRELASQILENIRLYGHEMGLKYVTIFGGVSINTQIKNMKNGFDIVVATPGRLLDLMNQGHVRFSQLEVFVLDEADRMLDMGFIHDVKKIIAKLPKEKQTIFFSATMPKDIAVLADAILKNPQKVEVTPQATTVEKIDQKVNFVDKANKPALLKHTLEQQDVKSVLIFSRTKHGANRIVKFLDEEGITTAAIHGNKSQPAREKALGGFREGKIKVLVATDIAARGIDIPTISHVINYDIPNDPESYVHRIGRTARAGREGIAISFCDFEERDLLRTIEKVIKYKIPIDETHPFHGIRSNKSLDKTPKNNSNNNSKPKKSGERPTSYFAEGRREFKDGNRNTRKPAKRDFSDRNSDRNEGFNEKSFNENRRPKRNFDRDSDQRFSSNPTRSRFSDNRNSNSNFGEERRSRTKFADEGRFDSYQGQSQTQSKWQKPNSFNRNKNSEGNNFGDRNQTFGEKSFNENRRPKRNFDRDSNQRFSSNPTRSRFSDNRNSNSSFGEERRSRTKFADEGRFDPYISERPKRPSKSEGFNGDRKRSFGSLDNRSGRPSFGNNKNGGFGGKRGGNNNGRRPTKKF